MKRIILVAGLFLAQCGFAFEEVFVTPNTPQGWETANVRDDAMVEININQPLLGDGSLMFATDTVTNGQDKGDYQYIWQTSESSVDFADRTLANLSQLSYIYYRDSSSTTAAHFSPVFRLQIFDDGGTDFPNVADDTYALLIWEGIYNGINPAPTDSWEWQELLSGNFWAFVQASPGGSGVLQNFNSTLEDWMNGTPTGQPGDPSITLSANSYVLGVNIGVGSGWGNAFTGYVDAVRVGFGNTDDVLYNFEFCDILMPNPNPDVIYDNSFECFQ